MPKKLTHKQFVDKAKKIHDNKYEYPELYIGSKIYMNIFCPKKSHGFFRQKPNDHLNHHGCPKCAKEKNADLKRYDYKKFYKIANKTHKSFYDYSLAYEQFKTIKKLTNKTKVKITCPIHGMFLQTINAHLNKQGCPKCAGKQKTTRSFVKQCQDIHKYKKSGKPKYDYSKTIYSGAHNNITVTCFKHGNFEQKAYVHLQGHGCPKCSNKTTKNQLKLFDTLKKLDYINPILEHFILLENNKTCFADIFIPEKNLVIEYYGDYWHCNPKKYKPNYYHKHKKTYARNIWGQDKERNRKLKNLGYKIIIIWEQEYKAHEKQCVENLIQKIKKLDP